MKIAQVIEGFFPNKKAGTEIYVLNLCKFLLNKGWEVYVVVPTTVDLKPYIYEGILVYTFNVPDVPDIKELNGLIPPKGIENFIEIIKLINPDIVHFQSFGRSINSYSIKAIKKFGFKTAFTLHLAYFFCTKGDLRYHNKINCIYKNSQLRCNNCLMFEYGKKPFWIWGLLLYLITNIPSTNKMLPSAFFRNRHRSREINRVKKYSDITFSLLPWINDLLNKNGFTKNILSLQSLPNDFNKIVPKFSNLNNSKINFGFVGRMQYLKGFHILLDAFTHINNNDTTLNVITQSETPEIQYYHNQKNKCLKFENIFWREDLTRQELIDQMSQLDILVIPSIVNETGPLILLEAWSLKIPILASKNMGILDQVIDGVNGILFEMNNITDLKQKIEMFISNKINIKELKENIPTPLLFDVSASLVESEYKNIIFKN